MAAPTLTVEAESRATMTLNMSRAEMDVVEHLAASHDLSKTRVMRQALKVYQLIQARLKPGQQLRFGDEPSKSILFVGPGFEPVDSCTYDGKECYVARGTDDAHYRCGTSACPHPNTTRATPSQTTGEVETGDLGAWKPCVVRDLTCDGAWHKGWDGHDPYVQKCPRPDPHLKLAHGLLGEFCACYAEAWPAKTCDTEARKLAEKLRGLASPPPMGEPASYAEVCAFADNSTDPIAVMLRDAANGDPGNITLHAARLAYAQKVLSAPACPPPIAGPTKEDLEADRERIRTTALTIMKRHKMAGDPEIAILIADALASPGPIAAPSREEIEETIVEADQRLAYSMNLVKLVDGDHTYRLQIDDETLTFTDSDTPEWNAQQRLYEHIAGCKGRIRADSILALFNGAGR